MENPLLPQPAHIKEIKQQTYDTTTYTLELMDGAGPLSFQPGQFNMITLFGIGEAPISLSSQPSRQESFDHTIRAVGNVTNAMTRLQPGASIGVRGPYGQGWPMDLAKEKDLLIVSGGIGLAPLRPVITEVFHQRKDFGNVEICYGARTPDDLLFTDEFDDWAAQDGTHFLLSADKVPEGASWDHNVGVVTTLFGQLQTKPEGSLVMTCGPEIMMKFVIIDLLTRGFQSEQIYVSLERRMNCGVGLCGHCQIGPKYVCRDGPVFPYSEISKIFGIGI